MYDKQWLEDEQAELEYIPLDDTTCCVLVKTYAGQPVPTQLDRIIRDVTENRKSIRRKMKTITDPFELASMDAAQLSCKVGTVCQSTYMTFHHIGCTKRRIRVPRECHKRYVMYCACGRRMCHRRLDEPAVSVRTDE